MRHLLLLLCILAPLTLPGQSTVPTVARVIPTQALSPGGTAGSINLAQYFAIPGVTGQVVLFDTVMGKFLVELRDDVAPRHVANFLNYVSAGRYTNSFFHRIASLETSGAISIAQGGGYTATNAGVDVVPKFDPIPLEYNLPNARGTLAAARTSNPNSATSEWYFNVRDNSTILDQSNGGGYTVFGRVLGTGMTVVDSIAALPRVNASGGDPNSPFGELPVRDYTGGNVPVSSLVTVNAITPITIFPSNGGTAGALTLSAQSSAPGVVNATVTGATLTLTPGTAGNATVTVTATDVNGNSTSAAFQVNVGTAVPAFDVHPASRTVATGSSVVFTARATAANSYQWRLNGNDLPGATDSTLLLRNVTGADAGTYTVVAVNPNGTATSAGAQLAVSNVSAADVGRVVNLSIRSHAASGDQTLIVGFTLGGASTSGNTPLLLRAIGPTLANFGVAGAMADPTATLYSGSTSIASNNNWGGESQILDRARLVQAFDIPANSLDAALAVSPAGGSYTMQVTGNGGATGTALAEIYEASATGYTASTPRLINVSARTQVSPSNVLIAGFAITGSTAKTLLIRANGPALAAFGVGGTLANPWLRVMPLNSSTVVAENDDWAGNPQVATASSSVFAFPISNGASRDAAVVVTLPPGSYTAQVAGADNGTGVALVEVYEVP